MKKIEMLDATSHRYAGMIMEIVKKQLPHAEMIVYGSRARGTHRSGSDIDVALNNGSLIDVNIIRSIRSIVEDSRLPILFDIVDYHKIDDELRDEIDKDGVIWKH